MWYDWTYLLILPGLIVALWAEWRVKSAYSKYSKVPTASGRPAYEVVGDMLSRAGCASVAIGRTQGTLTDHYDPRSDTLSLSEGVYASSSVAALGIAAHEAGHALQKHEDYAPLALRSASVQAVNIGSKLSIPIFIVGLIASWSPLMYAGIALFTLVVLFSLVTLPVEFNASRRAIAMLTDGGAITQEEEKGVRAVLSAAAMTYVASALSAILQLLRLVVLAGNRRRD